MTAAGISIRYLGKKPGLDLSIKGKLKKIFKEERTDAVHVHLNAIKYAAPAAKAARVGRCVYTVHNVADKDASGFSRKLNAYFFKHSMATPVALTSTVKESITDVYGICPCKIPVVFNGIDLAKCIKKCELIAYEDLGAEALRKLYVEDMPLVVIIDSYGNNLYARLFQKPVSWCRVHAYALGI